MITLKLASVVCTSETDEGESPLFPPQFQDAETAKEAILDVIHHDPHQFGIERTRWTLDLIRHYCDWLRVATSAGMHMILDRLEIVLKRGRQHVYSPDPDYDDKMAYVHEIISQARTSNGDIVAVYQDELTFYRQPTLANAFEERGHKQPLVDLSYSSNTKTRVVATMDALTGKVVYLRGSKTGLKELVGFYQKLTKSYSDARRIYVVLDNWPMHFHADLLVSLKDQQFQWPLHRSWTWSDEPSKNAKRLWSDLQLPIYLVQLPTYAPWTNPIEKLWRKLNQELLHLHRLANHLEQLRQRVDRFLDQFANGSTDLLRYVGLIKSD